MGRGMMELRAGCEVYTRDTPYSAWRALLRQLLGVASDASEQVVADRLRAEIETEHPDLLPWLSLIGIVVDVEIPPSTEVAQLAEASRAAKLHEVVLRALSRALVVPTIVEVEQAHLMDAASAALFRALALELESSAWVVLVTRRDVDGGLVFNDCPHHRIELGPLAHEDVLELAASTLDAAHLPPHVVELAVERSGGARSSSSTFSRPPAPVTPTACPTASKRPRWPASTRSTGPTAQSSAVRPSLARHSIRATCRTCLLRTYSCPILGSGTGCRRCSSRTATGKCAS